MASKRSDKTAWHETFKLSQRGDYRRKLEMPGIIAHAGMTFKILFRNYKLFGGVIAVGVLMAVLLVGLMDQTSYATLQKTLVRSAGEMGAGDVGNFAISWMSLVPTLLTGGLTEQKGEAGIVFAGLIFLLMWLVTLYIVRRLSAGRKVKLREALYNSGAPLLSSFVILALFLVECIPIILLMVVYAAAMETDFLTMPFYAFLFLGFAVAMIAISVYLLPSSLMALVAVSAPGLYPAAAVSATNQLMVGRRIHLVVRVLALVMLLFAMWCIVMLPIIAFDLALRNIDWMAKIPLVPFCTLVMVIFSEVFTATYFYIYYKWMVDYEKK